MPICNSVVLWERWGRTTRTYVMAAPARAPAHVQLRRDVGARRQAATQAHVGGAEDMRQRDSCPLSMGAAEKGRKEDVRWRKPSSRWPTRATRVAAAAVTNRRAAVAETLSGRALRPCTHAWPFSIGFMGRSCGGILQVIFSNYMGNHIYRFVCK